MAPSKKHSAVVSVAVVDTETNLSAMEFVEGL